MSAKGVSDAVAGVLGASFTAQDATVLPVIDLNAGQLPPADNAPFLEAIYPAAHPGGGSMGAPGANLWRENGGFVVVINVAVGQGIERAVEWAEELGARFRGQAFGNLECLDATINHWGPKGAYYQIGVVVQYHFDKIG